MENIILYRAMCEKEMVLTLGRQSLQFGRNREKCFSPNLDWVRYRVMDGKFNHSKFKPDRYKYLLKFTFSLSSIQAFDTYVNEWKTNIRQLPNLKLLSVSEIIIN